MIHAVLTSSVFQPLGCQSTRPHTNKLQTTAAPSTQITTACACGHTSATDDVEQTTFPLCNCSRTRVLWAMHSKITPLPYGSYMVASTGQDTPTKAHMTGPGTPNTQQPSPACLHAMHRHRRKTMRDIEASTFCPVLQRPGPCLVAACRPADAAATTQNTHAHTTSQTHIITPVHIPTNHMLPTVLGASPTLWDQPTNNKQTNQQDRTGPTAHTAWDRGDLHSTSPEQGICTCTA